MIYDVIRKSDGMKVYEYQSDQPIEWSGMAFAEFDHIDHIERADQTAQQGGPRTLTKLEYLRRFTTDERVSIRAAATQNPVLADYLALMELAQEINTGDADTVAAVTMLEQAGLLAAGRANEVLNG